MSDVDFKDIATAAAVVGAAALTGGAALGAIGSSVGAGIGAGGIAPTAAAGAGGVLGTGITAGQAALTAATVGTGAMSITAQQEAAEQQRVANAARQRVSEIQNRRARLRTIEEQRIRGAQAQQAGVGAGIGTTTSTVQGTVASLRSQAAQNIGLQQTMAAGERSIFAAEQTAARAGARADLFGSAAALGTELGGYTPVRDLFGS